ncbi:hypothetical protein [Paenibacillus oceani]|uniref:Pectate lyase superfamily protein domain-containing protein n=1 Tax=Paenibacillus oceani TaxID=2772510 RepID=A0A927C9N7_9BACL|nr:hypothetical protein [Paenibacillus oceani]MBD2862677.1 hypothetical protein [Paenibacillus oceani]
MDDRMTRRKVLTAFGVVGSAFASHAMLKGISSASAGSQSVMNHMYGLGSSFHSLCSVDSLAELRTFNPPHPSSVLVTGYYSPGDGGEGLYVLDAADTTSSDNGGTVIAAVSGGRWKLAQAEDISARQFGARGDGSADDFAHLQAWLNCGYKSLYLPAGKFVVDGNTLHVPMGLVIRTDGYASELNFRNMTGIDGMNVLEGNAHEALSIGPLTIRTIGTIGRYAIVTPNGTGIFANKRPRYDFDVFFLGADSGKTIFPGEGWDVVVQMGDARGGTVALTGFGTFNPNEDPAGQHQMTGIRLSGAVGNIQVDMTLRLNNLYRGVELGSGTEGFHIGSGSEIVGCWYGIEATNSSSEPGGFITACHVNAVGMAYKLVKRPEMIISGVSAYRSDAFFNHSGEWRGIHLEDCQRVQISGANIVHGSLPHLSTSVGVYALRSSGTVTNYDIQKAADIGFVIDACPDLTIASGAFLEIPKLFELRNGSTDITIGAYTLRGNHTAVTACIAMDASINRTRIFAVQDVPNPAVKRYQAVSVSAAGTYTVKPRMTPTELQFAPTAGTAAYVYDIMLDKDHSVAGDTATIKVIGSSSANPTVRILNGTGGAVLSSFDSSAGGKRIVCAYLFDGTGWLERSVVDSAETSY